MTENCPRCNKDFPFLGLTAACPDCGLLFSSSFYCEIDDYMRDINAKFSTAKPRFHLVGINSELLQLRENRTSGSRNISPHLKPAEMKFWLKAFIKGIEACDDF